MKRHMVLAIVILLAAAAAGCGSPSAPTPVVPVTPILVTENTPAPTPTPTVAPTPTVTPPLVACQPVQLTKVTDDLTKYKKIVVGDSRAIHIGEQVFTVSLSGAWLVIVETGAPPIVMVGRGSDSSQVSLAFTEKQVYSVKLTCTQDGSNTLSEEVRFYFTSNVPYLLFP